VSLLAFVAVLSVASYAVVSKHIGAQHRDAQLINVAGRQRMSSQRIALLAQSLVLAPGEQRTSLRAALVQEINLMANAHARLVRADSGLYPPGSDPATIHELYFGASSLDAKVQAFMAAGRQLAQTPDRTLSLNSPDYVTLEGAALGALLPDLDAVVTIDGLNVQSRLAQLDAVALASLLLTLLALSMMGAGVLFPLARRQDRAVAELEQERNFAAQLMEHMGQGLALSGPDHRLIYANPAYARMLGRSQEELIGLSPLDLVVPELHGDLLHARGQRSTGQTTSRTNRYLRPDGSTFEALAVVVPHQTTAGLGAIAVLTDLTERVQAEQQLRRRDRLYRALAANYPEGAMLLFDHSLRYTLADGSGLAQVGLSPEQLEGKHPAEVFPAWLAEQIEADGLSALRGVPSEREIAVGRQTYLLRTLPVRLSPDNHPGNHPGMNSVDSTDEAEGQEPGGTSVPTDPALGEVFAGMAIVQDVSERRRAEKALIRAGAYSAAMLEVSRLTQADVLPAEFAPAPGNEFTPEHMALQAARVIGSAADIDWCGLAELIGDRLSVVTAWNRSPDRPGVQAFLEVLKSGLERGQGLVWQVCQSGEPMYISDYQNQPNAYQPYVQAGLSCSAFVPLTQLGDRQYVLVSVRLGAVRPWTTEDQALFQSAARNIQLSLERRHHVQTLERAALLDALTGLGNRRAFERDLERELERSKRSGEGVGVLMVDLDGLKQINDHEGHDRGDALLVAFAGALTVNLRGEDRVYRLGGDEYAAILVRAGPAAAETLEMRVRRAVGQTRLSGFPGVDASAGLAFAPQEVQQADDLLRRADERMYLQKQDHRRARQPAAADPLVANLN
jgi:diguanylate cyclase (GGDEF)-like protein/PAS domain S-box-containing protein